MSVAASAGVLRGWSAWSAARLFSPVRWHRSGQVRNYAGNESISALVAHTQQKSLVQRLLRQSVIHVNYALN